MSLIGYIASLIVVGLVIGGLGRLVVPGPNPIGIWRTIGIGLMGAFVGRLIGGLIGLGIFSLVLELGVSAGLVYYMSGRQRSLTSGGRR